MSERVRARRHHRSAQSSGWAVSPETFALFTPVVLAVLLMPLGMGGRHPFGQLFLSSAAIAAAVAWLVRSYHTNDAGWQLTIIDFLFVAGLAVAILQLTPLSTTLICDISPHLSTLLPCWTDGPWTLGQWSTLSLTPGETFVGISIFVTQIILVGCIFQSIQSNKDIEHILLVIAVATGLMAALGVVQYLTSNDNYLWFYEFAFNDTRSIVKGTFSNRNHYASFLAIGVGSLVWWTFKPEQTKRSSRAVTQESSRSGRRRQYSSSTQITSGIQPEHRLTIGLIALGITTFAVLLSLSRGGTMSLAVVGLIATGMLLKTGRLTPKVAGGCLGVILLIGTALTIHGMDRVNARLDTTWTELSEIFSDTEDANLAGRREVWQAAVKTITDFPILGTGIGSHAAVTKAYMPPTDKRIFTHAENSYLNLGVETGLIGLGVVITALVVGFICCVFVFLKGTSQEQAMAIALTGGLTAGTVHAATDFIWYVPACSTLMMLLGACAVRLASSYIHTISIPRITLDRVSATIASGAAVAVLVFIGHRQLQAARAEIYFNKSIKLSRSFQNLSQKKIRRTSLFNTAVNKHQKPVGASEPPDETNVLHELQERIRSLEQTVYLRPSHPQAWEDLAVCKMQHFGLSRQIAGEHLRLFEIRRVIEETKFETNKQATDWLEKISSDNFQDLTDSANAAFQSIRLNPFSGKSWALLSNTSFLQSSNLDLPKVCIDQALCVRPHEGYVLFEAAKQALLDGDREHSIELLQQCFAECPSTRGNVLDVLLPMISAVSACELLQPDVAGLRTIDGLWSRSSSKEEMKPIKELRLAKVHEAVQQAKGTAQSNLLYEAAILERTLGNNKNAATSITAALAANPNNFQMRLVHIDLALVLGDTDTAKKEIDWCLLRRPDSQKLQGRIQQLKQVRIEQASMPRVLDHTVGTPGEQR